MDWLTGADFVTRDCCTQPGAEWGVWKYLYQLANLLTAVAYLWIPVALRQRSRAATSRLTKFTANIFAAFIFLCGLHHICEVLVWYWPAYKVFTLVDISMAVVSFLAALSAPVAVNALAKGR